VRPCWGRIGRCGVDIEERLVARRSTVNKRNIERGDNVLWSYCWIQPVGRGRLSGFSGSPGTAG
jgi:hypothetical protein